MGKITVHVSPLPENRRSYTLGCSVSICSCPTGNAQMCRVRGKLVGIYACTPVYAHADVHVLIAYTHALHVQVPVHVRIALKLAVHHSISLYNTAAYHSASYRVLPSLITARYTWKHLIDVAPFSESDADI